MNDKRRSTPLAVRVSISALAILALMALVTPSVFAQRANDNSSIAPFKHVFVIMMENVQPMRNLVETND